MKFHKGECALCVEGMGCVESSHGRGKMTEGLNVWRNESHKQGFWGFGWLSDMIVPGMFGLARAKLQELKGTYCPSFSVWLLVKDIMYVKVAHNV